ncbi:MAG: type IV-A pilus assembly ATPase PilB, partial [Burkholderiales bacterium]|nr:type IV-A pilus assembly ATPase PilB [Burkholderiales bacterium]
MSALAPASANGPALSGLARAMVQQQLLRLDQAMAIQKKADGAKLKFIDEMVVAGDFPAVKLARFASETFGLPLMDLSSLDPSALPTGLIDDKLMSDSRIVPVAKRGNRLSVLLSDPTDLQAIDRVKFQAQAAVDPIVVEHDKLMRLIERLSQSAGQQLSQLVDESFDVEFAAEESTTTI